MTRSGEVVRLYHNAMVSASEVITSSRLQAKVLAVCLEIVFLMILLSAWPLWWFLLKAGIILAVISGAVELALRVVYWRKDRRAEEGVLKMATTAGASPRLNVTCSDSQGQLRNPHIPDDQVDQMAQTILRDYSVSRTPLPLRSWKRKFRALRRFIHEILNWNGE